MKYFLFFSCLYEFICVPLHRKSEDSPRIITKQNFILCQQTLNKETEFIHS